MSKAPTMNDANIKAPWCPWDPSHLEDWKKQRDQEKPEHVKRREWKDHGYR